MKRALIVSDTHGREENLERVLAEIGMPDALIHLGDSEGGEDTIPMLVTCPVYMVAGNCDFFSRLAKAQLVELGCHRILITHGHYHYVSVGIRDLAEEAKANGCDIAMFGHTHRPLLDENDPELTVLNPGSLSFPRQEGRRPSYALMEYGESRKARFEIRYL